MAHTHPASRYDPPSAGDVYALANLVKYNPSVTSSYVFAADGNKYALVVADAAKLSAFVAAYPQQAAPNADQWNFSGTSGPGSGFKKVFDLMSPTGGLDPNADAA